MLFKRLRKLSLLRRQTLPFVQSLEDYDILLAIGAAQEDGVPLGLKQLMLLQLAPPSTLQRRLARLIHAGIVSKKGLREDGRRIAYLLSRRAICGYRRFAQLSGLRFEHG